MRRLRGNLQHCVEFWNPILRAARRNKFFRRWNMNRLARLLVLVAVPLVLGLWVTSPGFAQKKATGEKRTVTGCLQKGDEADEFSITGEDGKNYDLTSSAVDLGKHLVHKV